MRLETERLIIEPLGPSRAGEVLEFLVRNREAFAQWEPVREESFFILERQRALLMDAAAALRQGTRFQFWMVERDTGAVVGSVNFFGVVRQAFQSCLVGFKTDAARQGRGYMTEALGAAVRHMFDEAGLHRVEANVMPRNAASLRVLGKLGFEPEGLARRYLRIAGVWEDHLRLARRNE